MAEVQVRKNNFFDMDIETMNKIAQNTRQAQEINQKQREAQRAKKQQEAAEEQAQQAQQATKRGIGEGGGDFGELLDYDSSKSIQKLNTQPPEQIPEMSEATFAEQDTPTYTSAEKYVKAFRNTGVAYFDNKQDLTLLDAYIAKQLGLDVKYLVHKVNLDMNAKINAKQENITNLSKEHRILKQLADDTLHSLAVIQSKEQSGNIPAMQNLVRKAFKGVIVPNKDSAVGGAAHNTLANVGAALDGMMGTGHNSDKKIAMARENLPMAQGYESTEGVGVFNLSRIANKIQAIAKEYERLGNQDGYNNTMQTYNKLTQSISIITQTKEQGRALAAYAIYNGTMNQKELKEFGNFF